MTEESCDGCGKRLSGDFITAVVNGRDGCFCSTSCMWDHPLMAKVNTTREEVQAGSPLGLLMEAAKRVLSADSDEIVTCSDCGQRVPYAYIGHHYVEPVHPGLVPDWCTRLVCRDCA